MTTYNRIAGSQLGSSLLFGGLFLATGAASTDLSEAAMTGALAAGSWFAAFPLLKRLIGAMHGA